MLPPALLARRRAADRVALYVVPHQDDEMITMGGAMIQDAADGYDVRAIIITDGGNSLLRTSAELTGWLGYTPTRPQFSAARDREFAQGVERLGATPIVPPYHEREPDGGADPARIAALVRRHAPPGCALRGTAPTDYHRDHRAVGDALIQLHHAGYGNGDTRLMVSSALDEEYYGGHPVQLMGTVGTVTAWHIEPYQRQELPDWWGIGYRSVPTWLDYQWETDCRARWYSPAVYTAP